MIDAIGTFISTLSNLDFASMLDWLPPAFAGAVISILGVLVALRILEVI